MLFFCVLYSSSAWESRLPTNRLLANSLIAFRHFIPHPLQYIIIIIGIIARLWYEITAKYTSWQLLVILYCIETYSSYNIFFANGKNIWSSLNAKLKHEIIIIFAERKEKKNTKRLLLSYRFVVRFVLHAGTDYILANHIYIIIIGGFIIESY